MVRTRAATLLVDSPVLPGELGAIPAPDALLVTHAHFDHVLARAAFPGVPLHAGPSTIEALRHGGWAGELRDSDDELYVDRPALPRVDDATPVPADLDAEVIRADGHAGDGSAFFVAEHGLLLCADHLCEVEIPLVSRAGDPRRYLATLDRLAPYVRRAATIVPGHGPALTRERALELLDLDRRYVETLATAPDRAEPLRGPRTHRQARIHADNVRKHPGGSGAEPVQN